LFKHFSDKNVRIFKNYIFYGQAVVLNFYFANQISKQFIFLNPRNSPNHAFTGITSQILNSVQIRNILFDQAFWAIRG